MRKRFFSLRGYMKSGTNWLGSLINSHADICVVGEFQWQYVRDAMQRNFDIEAIFNTNAELTEFATQEFDSLVKNVMMKKADPKAKVIGERTPHTIKPIILRDCPIISIVRDGRDVLVSRAFHLFNEPTSHRLFKRLPGMAKDLEKFQNDPWFFRDNPHMLLRHETMVRESMMWWRDHQVSDRQTLLENPEIKILNVRYEDLHRNVESERERIFDFLKVDPKRAARIEGDLTPGFDKERPTEFLRKGIIGDWENYFTDQTKKWFKDVAGEELVTQGYAESLDW